MEIHNLTSIIDKKLIQTLLRWVQIVDNSLTKAIWMIYNHPKPATALHVAPSWFQTIMRFEIYVQTKGARTSSYQRPITLHLGYDVSVWPDSGGDSDVFVNIPKYFVRALRNWSHNERKAVAWAVEGHRWRQQRRGGGSRVGRISKINRTRTVQALIITYICMPLYPHLTKLEWACPGMFD